MGITCSLCMKEEESIHLTDTTCHHCNTVFMDQESLNEHECSISNYLIQDMIQFIFY